MKRINLIGSSLILLTAAMSLLGFAGTTQAQVKKPNIVVIMTDDVGV
jgi:hypothetical protein